MISSINFFLLRIDCKTQKKVLKKDVKKLFQNIFLLDDKVWIPKENPKKTKRFYQFILIDTHSTKIIPECDMKDPSIVCFSKLKILKILSEERMESKFINRKENFHDV